jgi:hypothetical protein
LKTQVLIPQAAEVGLSVLFSERVLRGKALREAALLSWAQEARGSNPRALTTYFFVFNSYRANH